jgi:hypothetical protein
MARQRQHIYNGQAYLIELDTGVSLATATTKQIRYKKPDDTIGLLTAAETATGSGILRATMTGAINDQAGEWQVRSWVVFTGDANPVPGTPVRVIVEEVV